MVAFGVGNADREEVDRPRFPKPNPTPAEADAAEQFNADLLNERQAIGRRIRAWRHHKQMNQDDFADLVGVHRAQLGQLESGRVDVRLSSLQRVARALNIPLYQLLNLETDLPTTAPKANERRSPGGGKPGT